MARANDSFEAIKQDGRVKLAQLPNNVGRIDAVVSRNGTET